jgi:hypothetical protein
MSEQWESGNGSPAHADLGVDESSPDIERQVAGFLDDALSSVLDSARRSAADLVERTRKASEDHLAESRRLQEEAEHRNALLTEHQSRVEALASDVHRKVEDVRTQVREVPGRLEEALSPLKEALVAIEVVIGDLSDTLRSMREDRGPDSDPGRPRVTVRAFDPPIRSEGDWDVASAHTEVDGSAAQPHVEPPSEPAGEHAEGPPVDAPIAGAEREEEDPVASVVDLPQEHAPGPAPEGVAESQPEPGPEAEDPLSALDPDDPERWKFLRPADIDWRDLPSAQAS